MMKVPSRQSSLLTVLNELMYLEDGQSSLLTTIPSSSSSSSQQQQEHEHEHEQEQEMNSSFGALPRYASYHKLYEYIE